MSNFIKIYIVMLLAAAGIGLSGCTDDPIVSGVENVIDGEPATIGLRVTVDDMSQFSRAAGDDHNVETLWVAIYNKDSGECTFKGAVSENNAEDEDELYSLGKIDCKSGTSYIVAVANYHGVKAITLDDQDNEKDLVELLEAADTWDKFRSIIYRRVTLGEGNDLSISIPNFGMPMSGSYRSSDAHDHNDAIDEVNIKPGTNGTLSGVIHLRRILAHNTLNIKASGDVIGLEVLDIEVFNLPKYTWMHSRSSTGNADDPIDYYANAGDAMNPNWTIAGNGIENPLFPSSLRYTPPAEITVTEGVYTFDFYQFENKRTGTAETYADREKERKDGGNLNTGIYESLVNGELGDLNNNATYVKINARVTYVDPKNGVGNPDVGDDQSSLPEKPTSRTAEVTYVVHLGYAVVKDSGAQPDPKDFNCRRNAHYTYNITVAKVNQIIVEAFTDSENQPGAEGTVTDVTDQLFELDAHYGVFNIGLTAKEIQSFKFTMRTYDSGAPVEFYDYGDDGNNLTTTNGSYPAIKSGNAYNTNGAYFRYFDWIEIAPTTGKDVIATYPGYQADHSSKGKIMFIDQLKDYDVSGMKDGDVQWFTVFVNEYTYEARPGQSGYGQEGTKLTPYNDQNWKHYVNQPNRQAWFNVAMHESKDNESTYFQSKYALTQKSIQTYYDITPTSCTTALGLEHTNESFGMNLRWYSGYDTNNSTDNGRYNVYNSLKNDTKLAKDMKWATFIDETSLQYVKEITNKTQVAASGISTAARTYNVPMQQLIDGSNLKYDGAFFDNEYISNDGKYNGQASDRDPQTNHGSAQYIEAIYACMNRNRDENGNGVIDNAELKWYVPAAGKYLRMIIGRNSLSTSLMNYAQSQLAGGCGDDNNTMYHYFTSDRKKVWVDEGMSSSFLDTYNKWSHMPWSVRCIRNLGTDLTGVSNTEKVDPAYKTEINSTTKGGLVKVSHYYGTVLRDPVITTIEPHKTSDTRNKLAQYGFEIAPSGNTYPYDETKDDKMTSLTLSVNNAGQITATNYEQYVNYIKSPAECEALNKATNRSGWRVPNQKEIVIMMRMGVLTGDRYIACTQEHWTNFGSKPGNSSEALNENYRITSVAVNSKIAMAGWNNDYVRCVRDLTAAEANKSYEEVLEYKTK